MSGRMIERFNSNEDPSTVERMNREERISDQLGMVTDEVLSLFEAILAGQFHKREGCLWLYEVDTLLDDK